MQNKANSQGWMLHCTLQGRTGRGGCWAAERSRAQVSAPPLFTWHLQTSARILAYT